ncbi:hypothetical protein B0H14DRAFT_3161100 [Mycena olivaceomarginata]|nr:hypothetical protein B0H14DRAFT_3161100 [Mycena olivaceomarginata]
MTAVSKMSRLSETLTSLRTSWIRRSSGRSQTPRATFTTRNRTGRLSWPASWPRSDPTFKGLGWRLIPRRPLRPIDYRSRTQLRNPISRFSPFVVLLAFRNGAAVVDGVRGADETLEAARGEVPQGSNNPSAPRTPRRRITKVDSTSTDASDVPGDVDMVLRAHRPPRKVGDTYPSSMLPEVQGPFYALDKARLFQRDYRDADNSLIAPWELTRKLVEGTLVLVMVSFVTYVYHVQVDKLRILDPGNGEPSTPPVPVLPEHRFSPSTPSKRRPRDDATDAAFDSFGTKLSSPSPNKKSRCQ